MTGYVTKELIERMIYEMPKMCNADLKIYISKSEAEFLESKGLVVRNNPIFVVGER